MRHDPGPAFRALHHPGNPFILANAWDAGSARILAALGAQAIGTTSGGHAFTLGRPDMGQVTRDEALAHAEALVAATPLPVSGDFESGFGDTPEEVATTVRLAAQAGLAGCSIEDTALPTTDSYEFDFAVERIRAAASAARSLPRDFVLVARADGILNGSYDLNEALRRLMAFDNAGADCLYAPAPPDMDGVRRICAATNKPVNALAAGRFTKFNRADFAAAGVARISVGAAISRLTHRAIFDAASDMFGSGSFERLGAGISAAEIEPLLREGSRK